MTCRTVTIFFATVLAAIGMTAAAFGTPGMQATGPQRAVTGFWYTQDREGGIQLYPCGERVCGRFFWLKDKEGESSAPSRDIKNPNPNERHRPLCHMQFMGNFTPEDQRHFANGWIYNPRDGGTYSAEMTLVDHDKLELRGYLFLPLLGESQIWTRANSLPDCAASD